MRLSRDVVMLARLVHMTCWNADEGKIGGGGYSDKRYAIACLSERGVLTNLDSDWARTVRCDWARQDWRVDDGVDGPDRDVEAIDSITFLVEMYLERNGVLSVSARGHSAPIWIAVLEYMQDAGIVSIIERGTEVVTKPEAVYSESAGMYVLQHKTYEVATMKARIVDQSHIRRRFPNAPVV